MQKLLFLKEKEISNKEELYELVENVFSEGASFESFFYLKD